MLAVYDHFPSSTPNVSDQPITGRENPSIKPLVTQRPDHGFFIGLETDDISRNADAKPEHCRARGLRATDECAAIQRATARRTRPVG